MRTHPAGTLTHSHVGAPVTVAGWVARRRDHGGIAFIDLRDASGILQVVADPTLIPDVHELRMEYCVQVSGKIRKRPEGSTNPDLPTGSVELEATDLKILSPAEALPFMIQDRVDVEEATRLKYRYLDLRRPKMAENLRARAAVVKAMRAVLDENGFLEIETPTLVASTPEGARDFLVPSRLRAGAFYALPQSPQLFKQLLMISGVERYYQIARCYRDEDFRADRQVEFTQLDLEGSFWGQEEVLDVLESVCASVVSQVRGVDLTKPIPRLTWHEAMDRFGTDKPDTRFGMELITLTEVFDSSDFRGFSETVAGGGEVRGLNAGLRELSRSAADALVEKAKEAGAKGLVWMVVEEPGVRSPVAKFLSDDEVASVIEMLEAKVGDVLLLVADDWRTASEVLGRLRLDMGAPGNHDELAFLFVVDFPVFERSTDGDLVALHHPFTAPVDAGDMASNPDSAISRAYDVVLNGVELGSGSVRIHDPSVQSKVFEVLGISEEEADARFGWFLEALRYGTPPHAGFAFGIDRFVSILQDEPNIREVIPFPKTQTGADPMTGSPSEVAPDQLAELAIKVIED